MYARPMGIEFYFGDQKPDSNKCLHFQDSPWAIRTKQVYNRLDVISI